MNSGRCRIGPHIWAFTLFLALSCAHVTTPGFVDGPQGRLHVDDGGRGAALPVLFVHGNGASLTQWRAQLEHVRQSRRAVAFDLRGMGQSDPARNGDYSVAAMADDVDAVANALGLKRFVIVGHSYGGAVVAMYAARHPERIAGVVYADAGGTLKITDEVAARFAAAIRKDKDAVMKQWLSPILKPSSEAVRDEVLASVHNTALDPFLGALSGMRDVNVQQLVGSYRGPKLAIAAVDIESSGSLHVQMPDLPVKKINGVGHWLMLDEPTEFNTLLDDFLDSLDRVGQQNP